MCALIAVQLTVQYVLPGTKYVENGEIGRSSDRSIDSSVDPPFVGGPKVRMPVEESLLGGKIFGGRSQRAILKLFLKWYSFLLFPQLLAFYAAGCVGVEYTQ